MAFPYPVGGRCKSPKRRDSVGSEAAIALVAAAEEDVADAIDGEIGDEGDRRYSDTEEQEDRSTVVKEKHEGWTAAGAERSMVSGSATRREA
jgi:hypothetical protein